MNCDAVIVGAGMVGCACAAALARAGLKVSVVEREAVGSGATAAGMGHLVVMDDNPQELALTAYSLRLWNAEVVGAPRQHEFSRSGTLWIASDDEERAAARTKQATLAAQGIESELLDARALYEAEPKLAPGLAGGLRVGGDAIVYAPKSAGVLLAQAQRLGARLIRGDVMALNHGGVKLEDGTRIASTHTIVANGTAALRLLPTLPIRPKKGHLLITDRYPGFIRHQLVELGYVKSAHASEGDSVAFNLQPRPTGQVLIGSSRQFDTLDRSTEPAIVQRMLAHALRFVPDLAQLNVIRGWTGFRAATPDGLPLIGPHPHQPGIWLATGHEGLGITTSLATAELLTAQIIGARPAIAVEPYLPARFEENCDVAA